MDAKPCASIDWSEINGVHCGQRHQRSQLDEIHRQITSCMRCHSKSGASKLIKLATAIWTASLLHHCFSWWHFSGAYCMHNAVLFLLENSSCVDAVRSLICHLHSCIIGKTLDKYVKKEKKNNNKFQQRSIDFLTNRNVETCRWIRRYVLTAAHSIHKSCHPPYFINITMSLCNRGKVHSFFVTVAPYTLGTFACPCSRQPIGDTGGEKKSFRSHTCTSHISLATTTSQWQHHWHTKYIYNNIYS